MIESEREPFELRRALGMAEAAKWMRGRGGRRPAVETLRRWANPKRGYWPLGKDGPQLVLPTVRVNGEVLTMPGWVEAFEAERARLGARKVEPLPVRSLGQRRREHARAEARLAREGIGQANHRAAPS